MAFDVLFVVLLILLNGLFSMAEMAVVSARPGLLQQMAESGHRGARAALRLAASPGRFLSTVQFGITLVGVLAGAVSGASLAEPLGVVLQGWEVPFPQELAFGGVVAAITYASIVAGELVPKQFALNHAASIAAAVAAPMEALSRLALPFVALLDLSSSLVLRLLRQSPRAAQAANEEEVRRLIAESARAGVFTADERDMLDRVMGLSDRSVQALMTPRGEVDWVDADEPAGAALERIRASRHSRLPLCRGRVDDLLGVVRARDVLEAALEGRTPDLAALALAPAVVPASASALRVLEALRDTPVRVAVVVDEHGAFDGLVTDADILRSVVGSLAAGETSAEVPDAFLRADGTWLVDAEMTPDEARRRLEFPRVPEGAYETLAGFVLDRLGRVPRAGDRLDWEGWGIEVLDMDGHRIDKILLSPPRPGDGRAP